MNTWSFGQLVIDNPGGYENFDKFFHGDREVLREPLPGMKTLYLGGYENIVRGIQKY